MYDTTLVRWTITPLVTPRPWIACGGCGTPRPFQSSGKVRLNANGRKLDAWLIYRCIDCGRSWNRPLLERANVRDVDPTMLEALHFSEPCWVRAREFDINDLRRHAQRVEEFSEVDIDRQCLGDSTMPGELIIEIVVTLPTSLRLDRLLAGELGLSRSKLGSMHERGSLAVDPDRKDVLRRRIRTDTRVIVMR